MVLLGNSPAGVPALVRSCRAATAHTWESRGPGIPCSGGALRPGFLHDVSLSSVEWCTHHSCPFVLLPTQTIYKAEIKMAEEDILRNY